MAEIVRAPCQGRRVLLRGERGLARLFPGPAVGGRREFRAVDAGEDAIGSAGELIEVRAQEPGERRRNGNAPPFALGAGLELALLVARTLVGPPGADLGGGSSRTAARPVVGGFYPLTGIGISDEAGRVTFSQRRPTASSGRSLA